MHLQLYALFLESKNFTARSLNKVFRFWREQNASVYLAKVAITTSMLSVFCLWCVPNLLLCHTARAASLYVFVVVQGGQYMPCHPTNRNISFRGVSKSHSPTHTSSNARPLEPRNAALNIWWHTHTHTQSNVHSNVLNRFPVAYR